MKVCDLVIELRLEKLYGGKAYVVLRIPNADSGTQKNVDTVLVTKREAVVVSVKRFGGFVSINADGSWVCVGGSKPKEERHPDPRQNNRLQFLINNGEFLSQKVTSLAGFCVPTQNSGHANPSSCSTGKALSTYVCFTERAHCR
ncbi:uncharacterized protein LOC108203751 [Daucus carota subsp. sativus]|uniref:uncharacterized protein LOC108203751 n=1 Tax=Daucus carota subsp. sativus TaxID=79200 RepID=UPI0007F03AFE|nr:PREDICTED: uncharacterized protein LOC108203751 [Daucus carota subsp. sativus]